MPATLHLNANRPEDIERAAEILRSGGLVAFPTETVYGLGANALAPDAVARIFTAKGRPAWDPLIVHVDQIESVERIVCLETPLRERVDRLTSSFWPGPLTLLLPRRPLVPDAVTASRSTVGVRLPSHPIAQALLRAAGLPIAAPSANRFGHVSPTTAQHVLDDLDGHIDAVLDGGPTSVGVESTVLDPAHTPMMLYRAGAVTAESVERASGVPVQVFVPDSVAEGRNPESLPSPGTGIRHYAPEAKVILTGPSEAALQREIAFAWRPGSKTGILLPDGWHIEGIAEALDIEPWGRWNDAATLANELFAALRALESRGASTIFCPLPEPGGLLEAVRDRLLKAAREH